MAERQKEPMIGQEQRPTAIDYDAPISGLKVRDFLTLFPWGEYFKVEKEISKELHKVEKEHFKPETHLKPELLKAEFKQEKEILKELLKPEGFKGEKEFKPDPALLESLVDRVATRVVAVLKQQGVIK
jgi:hypothetical protein